jgi:hypothetical protein
MLILLLTKILTPAILIISMRKRFRAPCDFEVEPSFLLV